MRSHQPPAVSFRDSIAWPRRGAALAALLVLLVPALACSPAPSSQRASARAGALELQTFDFGGDFELPSHTGKPFRLAEQRGKAVLLFFGYTYCPDICPTTLATMAQVEKLLGDERRRLQTVLVSVDPERDTPDRLKEYVEHFGINAVAVTGPPAALDDLVTKYAAYYEKQASDSAMGYLVDHTSRLYLIDPKGRIRYLFRYGEDAKVIATGVRQVLGEESQ
jgi:protein SCO1/2